MVSNIGSRLNNPTLISGFVIHHDRRRPVMHGRGPIRRVTGSIIGTIGHALVNKLASAISGNGYKPTGTGVRRCKRPRQTLAYGGYRKNVLVDQGHVNHAHYNLFLHYLDQLVELIEDVDQELH